MLYRSAENITQNEYTNTKMIKKVKSCPTESICHF